MGEWSCAMCRPQACKNADDSRNRFEPTYTPKQGQYLAFIHTYTKINGEPPAERDMQHYFRTTPPSVHDMILRLEQKGLIERTPDKARSIRVLISPADLPPLE